MNTTNIYALIDPETNQVRYVGKANNISQRYKAHLNRARKHQIHKKNWIQQLKNKKLKPIMVVIDVVLLDEWIFWEKYWISQMKTWGFNLINYTEGGDGCTFGNQTSFKKGAIPWNKNGHHSEESRKKMSQSQKGRILTQETKNKMSKSHKGIPPAYMKNGIPENILKKMQSAQFKKGGVSLFKGKRHTNESREKMSISQSKKAKQVLQYTSTGTFIAEHNSIEAAAKSVKGWSTNISAVCNGRLKTYKNYLWKFRN